MLVGLRIDPLGIVKVHDKKKYLKRRAQQLEEREKIRRSYERAHVYPEYRIESTLSNGTFSSMVAEAWQSIDLTDPELIPVVLRDHLKCLRKEGHTKAVVKWMEQFR